MKLTPRELELLNLIRANPGSSPEELARRLGTSRAAVNVHVSSLIRKGALLGRGYLLPAQSRQHVTVVGGANVDFKSRTLAPALPGTSNPGTTQQAVVVKDSVLAQNPLWLARYSSSVGPLPTMWSSQNRKHAIWHNAALDAKGYDTNIFNGSLTQLRAYATTGKLRSPRERRPGLRSGAARLRQDSRNEAGSFMK